MYVKSVTLRGFKSFASATHLRLEPGITCIVGPNGSGKSNVVDALAWVMGEQGAKSLRGGSMADVIFAGTSGRPPLGRAEVSMTIDNADGALPIDYAEVTLSRTLFRTGGSEYAINGTTCRLLDIQELLSDSGIGREMHVVVGQGRLEAVLRATPEERRGFIEEAAGVLKHRKRKERALRKLEQMEGNLHRIADLTAEIRRRLGPLGRQAESARQAALVQAEVRDARLRLLADELVQMSSTLRQEVAEESALLARRADVEQELARARDRLAEGEDAVRACAARTAAATDTWYALGGLRDRLAATGDLAAERVRLLHEAAADPPAPGRDPEALRAQAAQARNEERELAAHVEALRRALEDAVREREEAEDAYAHERERVARLSRAAADRREGLARLAGTVAARRSRVEAGEAEIGRLRESVSRARSAAADAEREFAVLEGGLAEDEEGEEDLDRVYDQARDALDAARADADALEEQAREADAARGRARARREALELGLRHRDGAQTVLAAGIGVSGPLAAVLEVEPGYEAAVAAALGWAADALVADSLDAARDALGVLRAQEAGQAGLLVVRGDGDARAGRPVVRPGRPGPELPPGARWVVDVVSVPDALRPVVTGLLDGAVLAPDEDTAVAIVSGTGGEGLLAVTPGGDAFAADRARGGSAGGPSQLEVRAAVEEAAQAERQAGARAEQSRFALARAAERVGALTETAEAALADLHASDARMAAVAEQLGAIGARLRAARAEAQRGARSVASAEDDLASDRSALAELTDRLTAAEAEPDGDEPCPAERDHLEAGASAARATETEARLALRTREERARAVQGRADGLERAAQTETETREREQRRRAQRARDAGVAQAVATTARRAAARLARSVEVAAAQRSGLEATRAAADEALAAARVEAERLATELAALTDTAHRDEVARAQQRLRIEQLEARAADELGVSADVLVEEYGPHRPVGDAPYVRVEQEKRLAGAERRLARLGRINPLALEEYAALEERHQFLTEQLTDLRRSKADLLGIVAEVDARVLQAFAEAYADTAREFEGVFARLFPGGQGRLVLTDPEDMLRTGIDVEARPPGKRIKRLSLLSGGERSLTAVALLVAIFKARPSPFYILDEVEAALDDVNLGRLLALLEELRESSQLIVITHQKRTMEIADALYGVSMRGDGVTTVVSQRLRDALPA